MAKGNSKQNRGDQGSIIVRHVEIDGRSIPVMFKQENQVEPPLTGQAVHASSSNIDGPAAAGILALAPETSSDTPPAAKTSKELDQVTESIGEKGTDECLPTVRQNDYEKRAITNGGAAGRANEEAPKQPLKKPYTSLFANNRLPTQGSKLEYYNLDEGRIILGEEDIQHSDFPWERCLVGYFGGKFPGKQALNQIVAQWKAQVSIKYHGSGWIVFQFQSTDEQTKVLENGPYMIYGRPLLLKSMPKYFAFGKATISALPVWVQLRDMPLYIWNPVIIGKICSKIGKPIHMDKLTVHKERITFARCLVEVDMAQDLVQTVLITLPNGEDYEQTVFYENPPRYCPHCKVVGHTKESCKAKKTGEAGCARPSMAVAEKSKEAGVENECQPTTSRIETKKGNHLEWVTKQSRAPKSQTGTGSTEKRAAPEMNLANSFSLLNSIPEDEGNSDQIPASQVHPEKQMGGPTHSQMPNSKVNLGKTSEVQQPPKVSTGGSVEKISSSTQVTVGSAEQLSSSPQTSVPVQKVSTRGEKRNKTQQTPKEQVGCSAVQPSVSHQILKTQSTGVQKKIATQATKRSIAAMMAALNAEKTQHPFTPNPPLPVKGEEVKKKRDKKQPKKNDKATPFMEFCAEMGGDSPVPNNQ